ncbi:hypothetical protein EKN56_13010 [Limnobaculum zhutongyuii]|uniref:Uncharacterized protein n=1 Tax=Limnobaculum zhutongyuii TaxID=2498113 RepID=A0A411WLZ7_9GAMM|nr:MULTISPECIES: hypothetical protein [Limnobaculum]QBH97234.1 hypothetical protein EKN56_13010 [Limnobaculum zhutongyuii]TQS88493.1 hypothetical protein ELQ32_10795 [Limnobaculum zhutongyuii]
MIPNIRRIGKFITISIGIIMAMVLIGWLSLRFSADTNNIMTQLNSVLLPLLVWRLVLYLAIVWLLYKVRLVLTKNNPERSNTFTKIIVCFAILAVLCEYTNYVNTGVAA